MLNGLRLTISEGEHTAILGPNGRREIRTRQPADTSRTGARAPDGTPAVRVFGEDRWNVSELRAQLGIVSADLHQRFVAGNSEGSITGEAAVLSAFLVSARHPALRRRDRRHAQPRRRGARRCRRDPPRAAHAGSDVEWGSAPRHARASAGDLARALVLDEPTTGLDLGTRHAFMELVRGIVGNGTTLVLITHHSEEIVPEIERVILLQEGRVVADGAEGFGPDRRAAERALRPADYGRAGRWLLLRAAHWLVDRLVPKTCQVQ